MMATATLGTTIGQRYELDTQIGKGGMGVVHRAYDRLTQEVVALKQVTLSLSKVGNFTLQQQTDFNLNLVHEFKMLASLRHPNIVSVLDYGFDSNRQPYFTMEYLENAQTLLEAGQNQSIPYQVELLVQLLRALAYLHRRQVLHRDIKPANVLVVDGQVKILDFGLSTPADQKTDEVAGTLSYMAPEVLRGDTPTKAADLYAVGVIGYQLLTNQHPLFDDESSVTEQMTAILTKPPKMEGLQMDKRIISVIERLLAKQPEDRFQRAEEIIQIYSSATQQAFPLETSATRESFLQSAEFVGRESEFEQLSKALSDAKAGHGDIVLVSGESGVGKSRLLDELRTHALVQGAVVLQGQSIDQGQKPFQVWRDVFRHWSLYRDLTDLDAQVLKAIVPDIGNLLQRDIPDAIALSPEATQERLYTVIEEGLFQHQDAFLVIFLEDLQWEAPESLVVLQKAFQWIQTLPILIVASYRYDERPVFPDELQALTRIDLSRFSTDTIEQLSESMLGIPSDTKLTQFLEQETEGNPFFIVEVMRALAEEAGQLDEIDSAKLPEVIEAQGIQRIVQRRLKQVPEEARQLLEYSAIIGRRIEQDVLQVLASDTSLDDWLTTCANSAVLDVHDGQWRFAHDKLREGLLAEFSPEYRRELHQKVALAIESVAEDRTPRAATLMYHWEQAQNDAKTCHYAGLAGEEALKNGANQQALKFLEQALHLETKLKPEELNDTDRLRIGHLERLAGEATLGLGLLPASRQHMNRAIKLLLGSAPPMSSLAIIVRIVQQVLLQLLHRIRVSWFRAKSPEHEARLLEGALAYERLGELYFFSAENFATVHAAVKTLNLAEQVPTSPILARSYGHMSVVVGLVPIHRLAQVYVQRGYETVDAIGDDRSKAIVYGRTNVYRTGIGDWANAEEGLAKAVEIADRIGDQRQSGESLAVWGLVNLYQGKLETGADALARLLSVTDKTNNVQHRAWGYFWQAQGLIRMGLLEKAEALLNEALALLNTHWEEVDKGVAINTNGNLSLVHLYQGRFEQVEQFADEVLARVDLSDILYFSALGAYSAPVEVYLTLWEKAKSESKSTELYEAKANEAP